uniref:CSON009498 protein n=1 Tax=Culicoides sonorensis TaxID=179676 RepID=A0A336M474_CULSO
MNSSFLEQTLMEENLFANNHKLESINLRGNYLSKLDLSVLNGLSSLMVLDLSKNRLQSLSVYKSPKIETLRELLVQDNQLTELNENMIVKKYPNLERMLIQRNSLQCERVEEMSQLFEEYEISMQEDEKNGQGRNQNIVGDVSCLSDRQWNSLSCETRFAAIRDEWMWLKTQMDAIDDEIEE